MQQQNKKRLRHLKLLAIILGVSTVMTPVPANAEPITATLFGSAFAASFGGAMVSAVIGTAASWLGAQVINWLFPPATPSETNSNTVPDPTRVTYGERVARGGWFGIQPVGGHWVHANEYNESRILQQVFILGDGWHDELVSIIVNGRQHDLISETIVGTEHKRYTVDGFDDLIDIRFHDGRPGQAADPALVAFSPGWTAAKKYSGMTYVLVTTVSDRDKFNGIPEWVFIGKGLRCYDPRKDSTAPGGSGTHRFNDPTTWQYTANPAVQAYHYSRGFYFNGVRVLGAGYSVASLDYDAFIAAMNVCDETVTDPEGNNRKRYECHTMFDDLEAYGSVMDRLCQAMGGHYSERQGRITIFAGKAQTTVLTITDADLDKDAEITFNQKKPGEVLISSMQGTYTHPEDFKPVPYALINPPEFVYTGMEPRSQEANFPQVQNPHQGFLLAKMALFDLHMQASAVITLDISMLRLEINDWIRWISSDSAIGDRTYRIVSTVYDFKTMKLQLGLAETSVAVYADDSTADDIVIPVRERPVSSYITTVSTLAADPVAALGQDGSRIPGLRITYAPINDPAIRGVIIAYRVVGTLTPIKYATDPSPIDGFFYVTDFVAANQLYEVQATIVGMPGRTYTPTAWVEASGLTATSIASSALIADAYDNIDMDALDQSVRDSLLFMNTGLRNVIEEFRNLQYWVQEQDSGNNFVFQDLRRELSVTASGLTASYTEAIQVAVGPGSAIVGRIEELEITVNETVAEAVDSLTAQIDEVDGLVQANINAITALSAATTAGDVLSANFRMGILTGPSGYSSIGLETRQGGSGAWRGAAIQLNTPNNPTLPTQAIVNAQQFVITDGTTTEFPFVFSGGVAVMNASRINVIYGGRLESFDGKFIVDLNNKRISIST